MTPDRHLIGTLWSGEGFRLEGMLTIAQDHSEALRLLMI
jgi:hypothetical protein